ncbi:hypothetical protein ACPWT1_22340 [Ramlibacter sp. MMS24-I3-19]|uniref:hypothetical protein n=1 Tax=Ramlibacter sp. MMS24-I3-19 TaxID=3416606 RepID=UPI003D05C308
MHNDEGSAGGQQMDRDDEGQKQSPDDVAASGRPRRSGEGMDSVRHHLRDHLQRQQAEQPGDDASQAEG